MITDAIIEILLAVLTGFLGLLPAYTLDMGAFGGGMGTALAGANSIFPVQTLGACLAVVIGLRLFIAAVAVLAWIWDKVPFTFK